MKRALFWPCFLLVFQGCRAQNLADELALGEQALNAGNTTVAIQHFDAFLKKQPQQERALVLRSKAKYQRKDYKEALSDSQLVLDINPNQFTANDYNALWNIGVIYNNMGQFTQARIYLTKMKQADSTDVRSYENIAYSLLQEKKYEEALAELEQGIQKDSSSKTSFYAKGKTLFMMGQYLRAIQAYTQAIKLDPAYATAYENRAAAKYYLQDLEGCCADLKRCRELGMNQVAKFQKQMCP